MERPELNKNLSSDTFRSFYYLKEELVEFCRENALSVSGSKAEITERISRFLDTGEKLPAVRRVQVRSEIDTISEETLIEQNFVCSEKHRTFFKEKLGASFSFNVAFQKWLKSNPGKTYADAISAYNQIIQEKKYNKSSINSQFEYNTYIRDFFADNKGKTLAEAIKCWKYKKSLQGHNRYEQSDLAALFL